MDKRDSKERGESLDKRDREEIEVNLGFRVKKESQERGVFLELQDL